MYSVWKIYACEKYTCSWKSTCQSKVYLTFLKIYSNWNMFVAIE